MPRNIGTHRSVSSFQNTHRTNLFFLTFAVWNRVIYTTVSCSSIMPCRPATVGFNVISFSVYLRSSKQLNVIHNALNILTEIRYLFTIIAFLPYPSFNGPCAVPMNTEQTSLFCVATYQC